METTTDVAVWDRYWSRQDEVERGYPTSPSVLAAIRRNLEVDGARTLEVGAGAGRESLELARAGARVTVLDRSSASLAGIARRLEAPDAHGVVRLVRGDALASPFAAASFDLVFHQGLAEHFVDPMPLYRENFRLLRPGGLVLVDVPQAVHPYTLLKKYFLARGRWFAGWETQYTIGQLRRVVEGAGFEPVETYGDWMRPNFFYRLAREIGVKLRRDLPKYPLRETAYARWKDRVLDAWQRAPLAHYTQLTIGVVARKPERAAEGPRELSPRAGR